MNKDSKLKVVDDILERTRNASTATFLQCSLDTKNFVKFNKFKDVNEWIRLIDNAQTMIDDIRTYPSLYGGSNTSESLKNGKDKLKQILLSLRSIVELYQDEQYTEVTVTSEEEITKTVAEEKTKTNKVFIVHGHNNEMKLEVASVIAKLGLQPIILHEQPNRGRTVVEKFERLSSDISFAVVLLSPDDPMPDGTYRARQNVILELGYFVAKLGRENVIALYAEDSEKQCEIPSDISGVLYEPYTADGAWRMELVQELHAAGFAVDANSLIQK